jgi:L-threonylcarbamoyladenylate synthase
VIRLILNPANPDRGLVERGAAVIRAGGVVAVPTDTLYGLAADPVNPEAVRRVFAAKERAASLALPLIAADTAQIVRWLGALPRAAEQLAVRFWPGPLTLLLAAPSSLVPEVAGGTGRVGVRVPAHAVARALCRASASLLTATSANPSGQGATGDPDVVERSLGAAIDLLLDAGPTAGGAPSTIVDVASGAPRLIRAGAIPWEDVLSCVGPV